mmetsp:Transcript_42244/g.101637  ORF Transcript_42244/g.101637 Transcript_42244/m.101637 type:complete len:229 (-) Transcript_42244:2752-3438(-)
MVVGLHQSVSGCVRQSTRSVSADNCNAVTQVGEAITKNLDGLGRQRSQNPVNVDMRTLCDPHVSNVHCVVLDLLARGFVPPHKCVVALAEIRLNVDTAVTVRKAASRPSLQEFADVRGSMHDVELRVCRLSNLTADRWASAIELASQPVARVVIVTKAVRSGAPRCTLRTFVLVVRTWDGFGSPLGSGAGDRSCEFRDPPRLATTSNSSRLDLFVTEANPVPTSTHSS